MLKTETKIDGVKVKNTKIYVRDVIQGKKAQRSEDVSKLTVETDSGRVFDADEVSQNRISRTIQALEGQGLVEAQWRLADNTEENISVDEFKEVLFKALQAQSSLWFS